MERPALPVVDMSISAVLLFPHNGQRPHPASNRTAMDQAEEAMDRLDWESVRDLAKVVLALDPENSDALVFLASVDHVLEDESAVSISAIHDRQAYTARRSSHFLRRSTQGPPEVTR